MEAFSLLIFRRLEPYHFFGYARYFAHIKYLLLGRERT